MSITMDATSGNMIIPIEWDRNKTPLALPRILMNQRDATTDAPICTGLENMTRPTP